MTHVKGVEAMVPFDLLGDLRERREGFPFFQRVVNGRPIVYLDNAALACFDELLSGRL